MAVVIDRFGNINSTIVGNYSKPSLRFPGGGDACEIASLCTRVITILNQKRRRFPEKGDYITALGYLDRGPKSGGKPVYHSQQGQLI